MSGTKAGGATFRWDVGLKGKLGARVAEAQKVLDSEVLRGCSAYVPFLTGALQKSGTAGTVIGSGEVKWIVPYAKRRYYEGKSSGSNGEPLRGTHWFERWKTANGQATIDALRREFGGG